jgi:hypothetical protein
VTLGPALAGLFLAMPLAAQATLADAAGAARTAWLAHDAQAIVGHSPTLALQIPGANPSAALERGQAAELLRRYLRSAVEHAVRIRRVDEVGAGNGVVELEREYGVGGTADVRRETILLRYRRVGDRWELIELRWAP